MPALRGPPRCAQTSCYHSLLKVISTILFMPTKLMLHVALEAVRTRGEFVWGEARFVQYFFREYVCTEASEDEDAVEGKIWTARWWTGVRSRLSCGHPASQQPAEQWNRKCKEDMKSVMKLRSHTDVAKALLAATGAWQQDVCKEEAVKSEKLVSLLAPPEFLHAVQPDQPDSWMLGEKPHYVKKPFTRFNYGFLTISGMLRRFEPRLGCLQCKVGTRFTYYGIPVSKPVKLPRQTFERMVRCLKAATIRGVRDCMLLDGVLEKAEHVGAPYRFNRDKFHELWTNYCLLQVERNDEDGQDSVNFCSCWLYRWRGHCAHLWALMEYLGLRKFTSDPIPARKRAQTKRFARGSSDEEPDRPCQRPRISG